MPETSKKSTHYLRYIFTEEEIAEKAKLLALSIQRKAAAEVEKTAVVSDFTQRIKKELEAQSRLANDMNSGWEMRNITCSILLDSPDPGKATVMRDDTGEIVEVRPMLKEERQGTLELIAGSKQE